MERPHPDLASEPPDVNRTARRGHPALEHRSITELRFQARLRTGGAEPQLGDPRDSSTRTVEVAGLLEELRRVRRAASPPTAMDGCRESLGRGHPCRVIRPEAGKLVRYNPIKNCARALTALCKPMHINRLCSFASVHHEHLADGPIHKLLLGLDPVAGESLASQPVEARRRAATGRTHQPQSQSQAVRRRCVQSGRIRLKTWEVAGETEPCRWRKILFFNML